MLAARGSAIPARMPAGRRRCCGHGVRVRVPRPPLDGLIDDLYYLECAAVRPADAAAGAGGAAHRQPGAPFRIRGGTDIETVEYADGCVVTPPTRAWEFGYPLRTRSVGVHVKPWGRAVPADARGRARDRPVTIEQVWGRPAIAELRDRLAADGPHQMLTLLEAELMRRLATPPAWGWSATRPRHRGDSEGGDDRRPDGGSRCQQHSPGTAVQGAHRRHPEAHTRNCRFATTVLSINPAERIDWADLAGRSGYFDQAHFGHEFGRSPGHADGTSRFGAGSCANIPATCWRTGCCRPIDFYKSDGSRQAIWGAHQSRGESHGQGGHVQLGVGGRLRCRRE